MDAEPAVLGEALGDPVEVVPYDSAWPGKFEELRGRLAAVLGPAILRIDHKGSTAVPGLPAKPVVNAQVGVADLEDEEAYRPAIESLGWPLRRRSPEQRFFRPKALPREAHVHVVEADGEEERRNLLLVFYLRAHPGRRDAYARLKRGLAVRFAQRREDCLSGKAAFIRETLRLAETEVGTG